MRKFYGIFLTLILAFVLQANAQTSFSFTCARDTTIDGCSTPCITLKSRIPNIHASTNSYVINPISGNGGCFAPYVDPNIPGTPTSITQDDRYSDAVTLPFTFPFFGTDFTELKISGNGYVSFDPGLAANSFSHYGILSTGTGLSATGGTPQDLPNTRYDRALIMGPYHDINPATTTSPNRRIKYETLGVAPHRKWIVSYYKIPLFDCTAMIENTHQIVLYEGTGIVEVFVNSVQICTIWNQGRSMIGMQNYNRDQGIMAPGRKASDAPWGSINMNESWRFVPASGPTLYRSTQLFDLLGNLVSTGDTTDIGNNLYEVAFPNVCPNGTTTYVVKTKYEQYNNPGIFEFATDTVRVIAGSILSATYVPVNASCSNSGIGSATVTITGAVGPFEYSLDGITWQASNVFNLAAGTYTIYYRIVGNACVNNTSVTIGTDPNLVAGTYVITHVNCKDGTDGSIVVTASGGSTPYQYSKDGGTIFQPTGTFSNLTAGSYVIRIKDALGCLKDTTIIITEPLALTAGTSGDNAVCNVNPVNGTITVSADGGTIPYSYSIDGTTYQSAPIFTVADGPFTVTVKDAHGCTTTSQVTVGLTNDLTVNTVDNASLCLGNSLVLTTTSNYPNATYAWTGPGLSASNIASPTATPTNAGVSNYAVVASLGHCTATDQVAITSDAQVVVNAGNDASITLGDQIQLNASITGASSFTWTSVPTDGGLSSTSILNPFAKPTTTTTYRLTGTNSVGCTGFDEVTITVVPYCVRVRNAFTPNGDGNNDLWKVYDEFDCLKNVSVHVFNRYGSSIFESKDYRNTWDGNYKGKSVPDGTYYAVIEFQFQTGKTQIVKTDLTILR